LVTLNIFHSQYQLLLQDIAAALHMDYTHKQYLAIKPPAGTGYLKILQPASSLQVLLADVTFAETLVTVRSQSDKRFFILHFDDVFINDTAQFKVDDENLKKTAIRHAVARLTSNGFTNTEVIPANTPIKSVKILFSEEWLKKHLGLDALQDSLHHYLFLKTESFDVEKLDLIYCQLLDELWNTKLEDPMQQIFLENRITQLMERFFTRLNQKMNLLQGKFTMKEAEIKSIVIVAEALIKDFSRQPPSIDEFSTMVSMSATKLKKNFKDIYGDSIYAYYQKLRMSRAKELLIIGTNVKETALAIGYTNTSNFVLAFKKQFGISPTEVAKN
jgi:AraC-like DNA-binding protein